MAEKERKFPTEEMLKAQAELDKIPEEENLRQLREEFQKYSWLVGEVIDIDVPAEEKN